MCYLYYGGYIAILIVLLMLLLSVLTYTFIWYAQCDPTKHDKWKNKSIKTKLASVNFVYLIKEICLQRNLLLLEISPTHAFIKQNPSWSHWGAYYYIELDENAQIATVWCRSGIGKRKFRPDWLADMVNLMFVG
jgi:hypothetical protein